MTDDKKQKLIQILFPTETIRTFLCNDVFQEILKEIPKSRFINSNYVNDENRKLAYKEVSKDIRKFLFANEMYSYELNKFYNFSKIEDLTTLLIEGIVFYLVNTDKRFSKIEMFDNKKSICYSPISILDLI